MICLDLPLWTGHSLSSSVNQCHINRKSVLVKMPDAMCRRTCVDSHKFCVAVSVMFKGLLVEDCGQSTDMHDACAALPEFCNL